MIFETKTAKLITFSMAIITGTPTPRDIKLKNVWDYEPGVKFFYDIVILLAPTEPGPTFNLSPERRKTDGRE